MWTFVGPHSVSLETLHDVDFFWSQIHSYVSLQSLCGHSLFCTLRIIMFLNIANNMWTFLGPHSVSLEPLHDVDFFWSQIHSYVSLQSLCGHSLFCTLRIIMFLNIANNMWTFLGPHSVSLEPLHDVDFFWSQIHSYVLLQSLCGHSLFCTLRIIMFLNIANNTMWTFVGPHSVSLKTLHDVDFFWSQIHTYVLLQSLCGHSEDNHVPQHCK